jgi:tyrosyl-tRNA synthetase
MIVSSSQKIKEVLTRRVEQVLPSKEGLENLMKRKKIRLYLGVDPTSSRFHLGHTIGLRKLQEFADLGHEAILVIGTGTVLAGDPSLRETARPLITQKEIERNIETWKEQAAKVLDFSKIKIKYNGDWLVKLTLKEIVQIASHISAVRLFQREMFQERIKKGGIVWAHETLYPLLQGYDSVAMDVDLEIGGTDQIFNMLIGRELQKKMQKREKFVLTFPLILGTDGKPMSKSSGNCVWLTDSPDQMFGKIMSIPDNLIVVYLEFLTNVSPKTIQRYEKELQLKKINPRSVKKELAFEIVKTFHSQKEAREAEKEFERIFKEGKMPLKIPETKVSQGSLTILELLVKIKMASSKSEAKRLVVQKGIKIDGEVKSDWREIIKIKKGMVVQAGKRRFEKIS